MSIYCEYCKTNTHSDSSCPYQGRYDPVGEMLRDKWKTLKEQAHYLALTLMDEVSIIRPGEPMLIPNDIEPLHIGFERLESEPDPRSLAQRARRSNERRQKLVLSELIPLYATLMASHAIR